MRLLCDDTLYITNEDIFIAKQGKNINFDKLINIAISNKPYKIISSKKIANQNVEYIKNIKKYEKEYINQYKINPTIIGVTGTNGKTSTTTIIYNLLKRAGKNVLLIGTNGIYYNDLFFETRNTTPSKLTILYFINKYLDNNSYLVIELSSQSFKRIKNLKIDYMIFTNLNEEHLDYHKTMKRYYNSKLKIINLIKNKENLFINNDDYYGKKISKKYKESKKYSLKDLKIQSINPICFEYNNEIYKSNLCGKFNVYNLFSAILVLKNIISSSNLVDLVTKELLIEGRNNTICYKNNKIVIDYAHTPFSFENIIKHYFDLKFNNLFILFGFGGNKDINKRSKMLDIAYKYSNNIILTEDNSRNEKFKDIIFSSLKNDYDNLTIIQNRKEAIDYAMNKLKNNDCLLILGKGNEKYILKKGINYEHEDKEEVLKWLI